MNHSFVPCFDEAKLHEAAELFAMARMSGRRTRRYEEHLLICPRCQDAVAGFDEFRATLRLAVGDAAVPQARSASC